MFVLLRHAHAVEKKKWGGLDADRPLSVLGREQANNLVATLGRVELRTLFTSPTARCRDTLAPLATARGLPIREHPLLAPDAPVDELRSVLDGADVPGTLWYTHGEILTTLADAARCATAAGVPIGKTAKGGAWILDGNAPLRYIDPEPPDDQ
ncbi:phosphoglycerate mutase family protein [Rhodococcus oxybenzonivorans]|uniref:SixA phosphatase family protein n=1 Tax=Rhodococcus oxybenzonivorans TaxID=1990687 RepID=UPI0029532972|nr:phosphoglycerate mutase family protein [Rhodococcus oxybenzonivorans]MDV7347829.1 phosphoglycerate mutase family protein [Rhodococcus oxybenzonivorans]